MLVSHMNTFTKLNYNLNGGNTTQFTINTYWGNSRTHSLRNSNNGSSKHYERSQYIAMVDQRLHVRSCGVTNVFMGIR